MLKLMRLGVKQDIPEDWSKHCVVLWEEDDAPVPDKERLDSAFNRITGGCQNEVARIDLGDCFAYFYMQGWVKLVSFDGGYVGILVRETDGQ